MSPWPDDVLFIRYSELATSAEERLFLLRSIGLLFDKPSGNYNAELLGLQTSEWNSLYNWVAQNNASSFWQIASPHLEVIHVCNKHVLVGTKQLIEDLREYKGKQTVQDTMDDVWIAAKYWVESEGL